MIYDNSWNSIVLRAKPTSIPTPAAVPTCLILTLAKTAADERDRLTRNFPIVLRSLTEQLGRLADGL